MSTPTSTLNASAPKIQKTPIEGVNHVYLIDWNDNGIPLEVAVVMETKDGSIYGILVDQLHDLDRKRLQRFVNSIHADKYPLWELLSQGRLNNGMNALDFFHQNYVKIKRPRGSIMGGGVSSLTTSITANTPTTLVDDGSMIGSGFTNPTLASVAAPGEY